MNKISGVLDAFFETGTEGVIWSLYDDKNNGYDSLHCLENGDYLKVFSESGEIEWEGIVDLEYKRNYRSFPNNPDYGQQEVFGFWVHGLQSDLNPEMWANLFFNKFKAELKKKGN